jgi:LPXTG-motif cell wall-anchored protein
LKGSFSKVTDDTMRDKPKLIVAWLRTTLTAMFFVAALAGLPATSALAASRQPSVPCRLCPPCAPPCASPSSSPSPSMSASPSPGVSSTPSPAPSSTAVLVPADDVLPRTGPAAGVFLLTGGLVAALGSGLLLTLRLRRRAALTE